MSIEERRARYMAKPGNRERVKAMRKRRYAAAKVGAPPVEVSAVLDYRRGVLHGLTAARAVAYNFNGGRSYSNAEIASQITNLIENLPEAIVVIGDALDYYKDEVPCGYDVMEAFFAPRRKS